LGIDREVVGLVVALALIAIGQHGDRAVTFRARDAPQDRLAGEQPAFLVKKQSIGPRPLAMDVRLALAVEPINMAVATGEYAQLRVPGRAFPSGPSAGFDFEFGVGSENRFLSRDNR